MSLLNQLIDLIYPPRCHICHEFLSDHHDKKAEMKLPICRSCLDNLPEISSPLCSICSKPFSSGIEENHVCEDCLRTTPFYDALGAPYVYVGNIMEAIHQFKYTNRSYLGNSLGPLLAGFAQRWLNITDGFLTIPVPLHPTRLRERGFNQSLLLARHVASNLDAELDFLSLRRIRHTQPQTGLNRDRRRKNVRRAFKVMDSKAVKGREIILVDDVATTGNTLNECTRVLKRAGCGQVFCVVLARTQ